MSDQPTPETAALPLPPASMDEAIKRQLEYVLLTKACSVTVQGKRVQVIKWGLKKSIVLGSRVMRLVEHTRGIISNGGDAAPSVALLAELLAVFAEDVFDILAASIATGADQPFQTITQVEAWLNESLELDDVFNLAFMVYKMNLEGESLGKLVGGLQSVASKVSSLSTSSSKS